MPRVDFGTTTKCGPAILRKCCKYAIKLIACNVFPRPAKNKPITQTKVNKTDIEYKYIDIINCLKVDIPISSDNKKK